MIDAVAEDLVRQAAGSKSPPTNPFVSSLSSPSFRRDCHMLEQYVNLMLTHPTFGRNLDVWDKFLTSDKPAARIKVGNKKSSSNFSFISKFMDGGGSGAGGAPGMGSQSGGAPGVGAPGSPRLGVSSSNTTLTPSVIHHHRDCDEFFQNEKDWVHVYTIAMKDTLESLNSRLSAKTKLAGVLGHLATALTLTSPNDSDVSKKSYKFFNQFSNAVQDWEKALQVMNLNDEATLSSCLDLWSRYLDAEREMLQRRTCLLIEYESANRSLDKGKGSKREEVSPGNQSSYLLRALL